MATKTRTRSKAPAKARRDVEAEITARVIEALEGGTVPWSRPWTSAGTGELPTSIATGRPYRGVNVWLLSMTAATNGYASPYWLTFRQAQERGGSVRKGEKGTLVVFWKILEVDRKDAQPGDAKAKIPMLRHYTVFNLEQCDDVALPPRFTIDPDAPAPEPVEVIPAVEAVVAGYVDGPAIRHAAQDRAYYSPSDDAITLPELTQFKKPEGYASTLFHELAHSTGHSSRLDRFAKNGEPQHFGGARYAREELVAEMTCAMIGGISSVEIEVTQSAAYIASWLEALANDQTLVIKAAQQAQKAVDRILGSAPVVEQEAK